MYCDRGLEMFQNMDKLKALKLDVGSRTGKLPNPMFDIPGDVVVECLVFCTDQEQSQITGGEFILTCGSGLGCTGAAVRRFSPLEQRLGHGCCESRADSSREGSRADLQHRIRPLAKHSVLSSDMFARMQCCGDKPAKLAFDLEVLAAALD